MKTEGVRKATVKRKRIISLYNMLAQSRQLPVKRV